MQKENEVWFSDGSVLPGVNCAICMVCQKRKYKFKKVISEDKPIIWCELLAISEILKICAYDSIIYTDSQGLVNCFNKKITHSDNLKELFETCLKLKDKKRIKINWIQREKNEAGFLLDMRLNKIRKYIISIYFPTKPKRGKKWKYLKKN